MKKDKVGFGLLKIVTEQFAIIESAYTESETIQMGIGIDYGIDVEHKVVACSLRFELMIKNAPFLLIHVRCDFRVDNEAWADFSCEEKKSICLPKGFASHLAVLTVGTARGVLHAKTENTRFNDFSLPTININDFVKEDVNLRLDELQD